MARSCRSGRAAKNRVLRDRRQVSVRLRGWLNMATRKPTARSPRARARPPFVRIVRPETREPVDKPQGVYCELVRGGVNSNQADSQGQFSAFRWSGAGYAGD